MTFVLRECLLRRRCGNFARIGAKRQRNAGDSLNASLQLNRAVFWRDFGGPSADTGAELSARICNEFEVARSEHYDRTSDIICVELCQHLKFFTSWIFIGTALGLGCDCWKNNFIRRNRTA